MTHPPEDSEGHERQSPSGKPSLHTSQELAAAFSERLARVLQGAEADDLLTVELPVLHGGDAVRLHLPANVWAEVQTYAEAAAALEQPAEALEQAYEAWRMQRLHPHSEIPYADCFDDDDRHALYFWTVEHWSHEQFPFPDAERRNQVAQHALEHLSDMLTYDGLDTGADMRAWYEYVFVRLLMAESAVLAQPASELQQEHLQWLRRQYAVLVWQYVRSSATVPDAVESLQASLCATAARHASLKLGVVYVCSQWSALHGEGEHLHDQRKERAAEDAVVTELCSPELIAYMRQLVADNADDEGEEVNDAWEDDEEPDDAWGDDGDGVDDDPENSAAIQALKAALGLGELPPVVAKLRDVLKPTTEEAESMWYRPLDEMMRLSQERPGMHVRGFCRMATDEGDFANAARLQLALVERVLREGYGSLVWMHGMNVLHDIIEWLQPQRDARTIHELCTQVQQYLQQNSTLPLHAYLGLRVDKFPLTPAAAHTLHFWEEVRRLKSAYPAVQVQVKEESRLQMASLPSTGKALVVDGYMLDGNLLSVHQAYARSHGVGAEFSHVSVGFAAYEAGRSIGWGGHGTAGIEPKRHEALRRFLHAQGIEHDIHCSIFLSGSTQMPDVILYTHEAG